MGTQKISDVDFIREFTELGASKLSSKIGLSQRKIYERRRAIEVRHNIVLAGPAPREEFQAERFPGRLALKVTDGTIIVGSDLHAWPGPQTTAFRGFVKFIQEMQPKAVIANGDLIDGASISRHPPLGFDKLPSLIEEIEATQELLHQVELAAPKKTALFWPAGNHDARFGIRLASVAPEYAKIHGTHLKDHFGERWQPCWSVWVNDGEAVIKHRLKGGVHAAYNNTLHSGKTIVTGHLHSLKVTPFNDYGPRTRWGVDCGMLADPHSGGQFAYLEDNPRPWRAGFVVLTFRNSELLWPEIAAVRGRDEIEFRGKVQRV